MPRYFVVQKDGDVIILDVTTDRYYWKGNAVADAFSASDADARSAVRLELQGPTRDGCAPRGRKRYWRFDLPLVARALFYLASSHRMASKGFGGFVASLDRKLRASGDRPRKNLSYAKLAAAMEWARLLFPFEAKCLPMSVATARMARNYGINAKVVVGVQALPLQAHAWAQVDESLINDFLDRVRTYKPIMVLPHQA